MDKGKALSFTQGNEFQGGEYETESQPHGIWFLWININTMTPWQNQQIIVIKSFKCESVSCSSKN